MSSAVGDPFVAPIASKTSCPVFGLTLVGAWDPTPSFEQLYGEWTQHFHDKDGCYAYPYKHLHMTIATLMSFRDPPRFLVDPNLSPQERTDLYHKVADLWAHLIPRITKDPLFPTNAFRITYTSTALSPNAGFFNIDAHQISSADSSQEPTEIDPVEAIRDCLRRAVAQWRIEPPIMAPEFNTLMTNHFASLLDSVHIPGIKHSTFLRFQTQSQDLPSLDHIRGLIPPWTAQDVFVDKLYIAVESEPYMHIPKDDQHIALEWPLTESHPL